MKAWEYGVPLAMVALEEGASRKRVEATGSEASNLGEL